ncbi:hypothetical protein OG520_00175 [Streptomyces sp. NBC_00984]|uniref:hypothetical protein n=1 Tax=Streptomyces sp. NBC_00984 TaxID=2903700 RepID=UPI003870BFA0|nr:hypothetical protein OG520_00175 [Streptomyces sp. NBC_00984]
MTAHEEATERAKQYERFARVYAKKAQEGDAGAAQLARAFASLAVAARMERMDWRMRVLGDQLEDVKKSMDGLRRKCPSGDIHQLAAALLTVGL